LLDYAKGTAARKFAARPHNEEAEEDDGLEIIPKEYRSGMHACFKAKSQPNCHF